MKAILVRTIFTTNATLGTLKLYDDNNVETHSWFTLEDEARPLGVKITDYTCIPEGNFEVSINYSNRFKRDMPIVYNRADLSVEDSKGKRWEGIRIHIGNYDTDTSGCILLGKGRNGAMITDSKIAFNEFFPILQAYISSTPPKTLTLTIINNQQN